MSRPLAGLVLMLVGAFAGCGGGGSGARDGSGAGCPDVSGAWQITAHSCQPSTVGQTLTITQVGCTLTDIQPWTSWSGTIDESGQLVISGDAGGTTMTCAGALAGTTITTSCTPTCSVTFVRVTR